MGFNIVSFDFLVKKPLEDVFSYAAVATAMTRRNGLILRDLCVLFITAA